MGILGGLGGLGGLGASPYPPTFSVYEIPPTQVGTTYRPHALVPRKTTILQLRTACQDSAVRTTDKLEIRPTQDPRSPMSPPVPVRGIDVGEAF